MNNQVVQTRKRFFTLEEANQLLSTLRPYLRRMLQLHQHLRNCSEKLVEAGIEVDPTLLSNPPPEGLPQELIGLHAQANALFSVIREDIRLVHRTGVVLKDLEIGLIDFPSLLNGSREVCLCWKLGENTISHFHGKKDGFHERKSILGRIFDTSTSPITHKSITPEEHSETEGKH